MTRQICLIGYFEKNLGDDLLFKAFIENTSFSEYIIPRNKTIGVSIEKDVRTPTLLERKIGFFNPRDIALIGGSLFIETEEKPLFDLKKRLIKKLAKNKKRGCKNYIIGCNLGPIFFEESYKETIKYISKLIEFWTVRDDFSYQLLKELAHCRVIKAPDLVHSLEFKVPELEKKSKKMAVISIVDFEYQTSFTQQKNSAEYYASLLAWHSFFESEGYQVVYASFEDSVDVPAFHKYIGKGEIALNQGDEISSLISNSDIVLCSRFHALILAASMGKSVIPFAYSNKMKCYLEDLGHVPTSISAPPSWDGKIDLNLPEDTQKQALEHLQELRADSSL